jgi:hypothetical protein
MVPVRLGPVPTGPQAVSISNTTSPTPATPPRSHRRC